VIQNISTREWLQELRFPHIKLFKSLLNFLRYFFEDPGIGI